MTQLLRGAPAAAAICEDVAARAAALVDKNVSPHLRFIRVGEHSGDVSYERAACKRCEKVGIAWSRSVLAADCSQDELLAAIDEANAEPSVHGILLFRPLPRHLDEKAACAAIDPAKDMDAATPGSLYGVFAGAAKGFAPCTAESVIALLDHYGVELDGAEACVVGRSLVIGKPVAQLLLARGATVTTCHTHTRDLLGCARRADVVVIAAGHPSTLHASDLREGQVVVDVGTNWDAEAGKLVGDVDWGGLEADALPLSAISPVPGGVGALTTAILARHVVEAAERVAGRSLG